MTVFLKVFSFCRDFTVGRSFYLWSNYGGCEIDAGWLLVKTGGDVCDSVWGTSGPYPTFLYAAAGPTKMNPSG